MRVTALGRVWRFGLFPLALMAAPALATPLSFGELDGTADLRASEALAGCEEGDGGSVCHLARTDFGGLPIERSRAALNREGRLMAMEIALDASAYDTALRLLDGRYGQVAPSKGAGTWSGFDDEARIAVSQAGRNTLVRFSFPANAAAAAPDSGEPTGAVLPLVVFVLLGLAAGLVLRRARSARRRPAASAEPSMRATLERRLARGDDLRF